MSGVLLLFVLFGLFAVVLAVIAFLAYRRVLRRAKGIERGLKMVPLLIHLPPPGDADSSSNRDVREVMREKVSQAQVMYDLLAGTATAGFKSNFYGQRHIAFELIASNGLIHFFAAVPVALVSTVEQAILTAYPGARIEEVEDHNIFNPQGKLTGTVGGELVLRHDAAYPIATLDQMEKDPIEGLLNSLTKLQLGDGAAVQIMLRPAKPNWSNHSKSLVAKKRHQRQGSLSFGAADIAKAAVKSPDQWHQESQQYQPSKLEETMLQGIEEKMKHPGFEILVRVIASSPSYDRSQMLLRNISNAFALYEAPGSNGFKFLEARDIQGLVTAFIFRFFPPEVASNILSTMELATLFHLPDAQFTSTTSVERQQSKQVDGPVHMPTTGLLLGYNFYRGIKKEIRLSPEDRRRHTYIVGQTGTGKSTILENLAVQDMLAGNGFAFIDPHGDVAEKLVSMVPKERAEDVIYFNPADTNNPLGLNLFDFKNPDEKDFIVQEAIGMLYKLYDPDHTGIIGPRFEHWFRMAALTLMADPNGASFIEIPKVFTDTEYLKNKFKYLTNPVVIDFWTKEMAQTSDYHKSEMLGWFVSKFGAFQSNDMLRNIIGQTHSAFNIRDIMDNKKILIVNLSKGLTGELNSQLLGMLFVIKIQAAAMGRSNIPEDQRNDFCLYVDEFQNFSTDSFASILSEARKYRLNLIVANQFIGQLSDEIREAVFGNIGTIMSYRCGPEDAEFLVKQFEPVFNERDLVNIPNHNAVMRLLIGGLPSQPFSITALPPLGQPHPEMGLAIKQLSAAKYGVPRATAEADIFARLQNKPRVPLGPVQSQVAPAPTPTMAQPIAASAPAPVVATPAPAAAVAPSPQPAPAPITTLDSVATPAAVPSSAAPAPAPSPQPASVPVAVPAAVASPAPAPTPAPAVAMPDAVRAVGDASDPAALSLQSLKATAPAPAATANSDHAAESQTRSGASLSDVVGVVTLPSTPPPATVEPPASPAPAVAAYEPVARGANTDPVAQPAPTMPVPAETPAPAPAPTPPPKPVALIEAHETDGYTDEPPVSPQSVNQPQPAASTQPAVEPLPAQDPTPTQVPASSSATVPNAGTSLVPAPSSTGPIAKVEPELHESTAAGLATEVNEEITDTLSHLNPAQLAAAQQVEAVSASVSDDTTPPGVEEMAEDINEQLEEKIHPHTPAQAAQPEPVAVQPPQETSARLEPAQMAQSESVVASVATPPVPAAQPVPASVSEPRPQEQPQPQPQPQSKSKPAPAPQTSDPQSADGMTPRKTHTKRKKDRSNKPAKTPVQQPTSAQAPSQAASVPAVQPAPMSQPAPAKTLIATHRTHRLPEASKPKQSEGSGVDTDVVDAEATPPPPPTPVPQAANIAQSNSEIQQPTPAKNEAQSPKAEPTADAPIDNTTESLPLAETQPKSMAEATPEPVIEEIKQDIAQPAPGAPVIDASLAPGEVRIDEDGSIVTGPVSQASNVTPVIDLNEIKDSDEEQAAPADNSQASSATTPAPAVKPGEIYVDDNGNVVQG